MDRQAEVTIDLTAELVAAYVSNNHVSPSDLPGLIASLHAALTGLSAGETPVGTGPIQKPALAQIRSSITHEALISFEDGRPYKVLRRHLAAKGLTPKAYREKWGLPPDYPMVAVAYSETREAIARAYRLGCVGGIAGSEAT